MSHDLIDYAHDVYESSYTDGTLLDWEQAFEGKAIEDCRTCLRKLSKDGAKIKPTDFQRQWNRDHPRASCPRCSGTGMVGDYGMETSDPCDCAEGRHMTELRATMAPSRLDHNRKMTEAERENGVAWARLCAEQLRNQSGRVKARRWVA